MFLGGTVLFALASLAIVQAAATPLLNEFEPNPDGSDPQTVTFELKGTPGASFSGWIISVECDATSSRGVVDRATEVSGTFDANGLLTVSVGDLENPSHTVMLSSAFTGQVGSTDIDPANDGTADLSAFGTVYDALSVPDNDSDQCYGVAAGGTDLTYIGSEPELVFRDPKDDAWYAAVQTGNLILKDANGNDLDSSSFDTDPLSLTVGVQTFGSVNPSVVATTTTTTPSSTSLASTTTTTTTTGSSHSPLPSVVLNEVFVSHSGTDDTEFFELYGAAGTSLEGLSFICVEGDSSATAGTIDVRFDFSNSDAVGSNGFFLVGNPEGLGDNYGVTPNRDISTSFIENGSQTCALVKTSSISGSSVTGTEEVIDAVGLTDGGAGDTFFFNASVVGPDGVFLPAGVRRASDGVDTDAKSDWLMSDFHLGTDNTPTAGQNTTITITTTTTTITTTTSSTATTTGTTSLTTTLIYAIQGSSHVSPLVPSLNGSYSNAAASTLVVAGTQVRTKGIVTAVDSNGFYLQDATGDGDPSTSDALFVFTSSAPTVSVGDEAQVEGTVSEFFPGGTNARGLSITQISSVSSVSVLSSINTLPPPVVIGASGRTPPKQLIDDDAFGAFQPAEDGIDFFESLEGMRVTAEDVVAVSPTNRFNEIYGVVNGASSVLSSSSRSSRGALTVSDGNFHPQIVQIDDNYPFTVAIPTVSVGDHLGDVTGVVGYSFGNFEIYPTETIQHQQPAQGKLQYEETTITGGRGKLTVATLNVLNLDVNEADGDTDVADGRFTALGRIVANRLKAPDIVGLQEVQDNSGSTNDGTTSADDTLSALVAAISSAGGPSYSFTDIDPQDGAFGGQPGGNIRNAFLYNSQRVSLESEPCTLVENSTSPAFTNSRQPLACVFGFLGENVTVVNVHFTSKGGSATYMGRIQPFETRQEDAEVNGNVDRRRAQSEVVQAFVQDKEKVVILGDFNEFDFVSPVASFASSLNYTVLTGTLPETERYTYIFSGRAQALDHIIVSPSLAAMSEIDIVHVNSEFSQPASDHDPVLARFGNVDECASGTHNCHQKARCEKSFGSFLCSCFSGYGNGIRCIHPGFLLFSPPPFSGNETNSTVGGIRTTLKARNAVTERFLLSSDDWTDDPFEVTLTRADAESANEISFSGTVSIRVFAVEWPAATCTLSAALTIERGFAEATVLPSAAGVTVLELSTEANGVLAGVVSGSLEFSCSTARRRRQLHTREEPEGREEDLGNSWVEEEEGGEQAEGRVQRRQLQATRLGYALSISSSDSDEGAEGGDGGGSADSSGGSSSSESGSAVTPSPTETTTTQTSEDSTDSAEESCTSDFTQCVWFLPVVTLVPFGLSGGLFVVLFYCGCLKWRCPKASNGSRKGTSEAGETNTVSTPRAGASSDVQEQNVRPQIYPQSAAMHSAAQTLSLRSNPFSSSSRSLPLNPVDSRRSLNRGEPEGRRLPYLDSQASKTDRSSSLRAGMDVLFSENGNAFLLLHPQNGQIQVWLSPADSSESRLIWSSPPQSFVEDDHTEVEESEIGSEQGTPVRLRTAALQSPTARLQERAEMGLRMMRDGVPEDPDDEVKPLTGRVAEKNKARFTGAASAVESECGRPKGWGQWVGEMTTRSMAALTGRRSEKRVVASAENSSKVKGHEKPQGTFELVLSQEGRLTVIFKEHDTEKRTKTSADAGLERVVWQTPPPEESLQVLAPFRALLVHSQASGRGADEKKPRASVELKVVSRSSALAVWSSRWPARQ